MKIKTDTMGIMCVIAVFLCVTLSAVLFCIQFQDISGLLLLIITYPVCFVYWLSIGRTIEIDAFGITVTFLFYKKHYLWDDLHLKRYVDCRKCYGFKDIALSGAEFAIKPIRRPDWMKPSMYSVYFHPFSYIYVYFKPKVFVKNQYPLFFGVDENSFKEALNQWGVNMQDAT